MNSMKMLTAIGLLTAIGQPGAVANQPNIVLIVADDLGYSDTGFAMDYSMNMRTSDYLGQPWDPTPLSEVHTPNIDRLAEQGVVFTSGYVNGNVCSPTRAGLMLGRYQQRVGIYSAGPGGSGMAVYENTGYSQSGTNYARINPILPEFLKQSAVMESNYVSGVFGKWHLGTDGIYELDSGTINNGGGMPKKQDTAYASIGGNFEEPNDPGPIANIGAGESYDPTWAGGSPWHSLNRGFERCFYFMGRGAHDYWDPNEVYDNYDPAHPLRRTVGLDARRNPGYSGTDNDSEIPVGSWDNASAYEIHTGRVSTNYLTVRISEAACDFIGENATNDRPFFCYVPYNAAHSPSHAPYHFDPVTGELDRLGTDSRRYNVLDGSGNPVSNITDAVVADWYNAKTPDPNWFPDPLYIYEQFKDDTNAFRYFSGGSGQDAVKDDDDIRNRCITLAMIRWMDKGIGEILEKLRDPNGDGDYSDSVYENTIVLFISDNGGASGMNAANAPLRGNKSSNWEGGIRSPFVFSWPAILKAQNGIQTNNLDEVVAVQQLVHAPVMAFDFLPTLLEINGLDPLNPDPLLNAETQAHYDYTPDGKSLLPLISGAATSLHDYLFWSDLQGSGISDGAVRKGPWKLHLFDSGAVELYHLDDDIAETMDVSDAHPDMVRELRQAYFSFMNTAADSLRQPVPHNYLYKTFSAPPAEPGTASVEEFDYPVGSTITNNGSNGGENWVGPWQKYTSNDNGLIDAGSLLFNDPASNYVDGAVGHHYGARRKQIEMSRTFSSSAVATPVWYSCLVEHMDRLDDTGIHTDQQRWEIHPDNIENTYLRVGEGSNEVSRFVANGTSQALDVPIDLDAALTYLVVMRMETDVSGNNDSVKVWIVPEGTAINGYSETDLDTAAGGAPNLDKSNADLWAGGLTSIGLVGDGVDNQIATAAMLDSVRVSFSDTNETKRIEALFNPTSDEPPEPSQSDAVAYHAFSSAGTALMIEYDETAGWLTSDATSGAIFEKATNLMSNDWAVVSPDETEMLDWHGDLKSYKSRFEPDSNPAAFYRLKK